MKVMDRMCKLDKYTYIMYRPCGVFWLDELSSWVTIILQDIRNCEWEVWKIFVIPFPLLSIVIIRWIEMTPRVTNEIKI